MNRAAFFAAVRSAPFAGSLAQGQVDGLNAILDEWEKRKLSDVRWLAYMLATTFHETARTMQPIREYGRGRGMRYGTTYYGRGFVQLTWEGNYRKASAVVGVDLVAHPDRALDLPIAAAILFDGMIKGWFTGHKLSDYIAGTKCDYVGARRIINGTDRASLIAGCATAFGGALAAAAVPIQGVPSDAVVHHDVSGTAVPSTPFPSPGPTTLPPRPPPDVPAAESPQPAPSGGFFDALAKLFAAIAAIFPRR